MSSPSEPKKQKPNTDPPAPDPGYNTTATHPTNSDEKHAKPDTNYDLKRLQDPRFDVDRVSPPRFHLNQTEEWREYLQTEGYVVLRDIVTDPEIARANDLFWNWMKSLGIDRNDPKTWTNDKWPGTTALGLVQNKGAGQTEFMWYLRALPSVHTVFKEIWGTEELLVSFDGFSVFRPITLNKAYETIDSWYHVDQGRKLRGLQSVQGGLLLRDAGPHDGGLVVIPRSHLQHDSIVEKFADNDQVNFVPLPEEEDCDTPTQQLLKQAVKLCANKGDFILWDSRTIHCNSPITVSPQHPTDVQRLTAFITMLPAKLTPDDVLQKRKTAIQEGVGSTHWTHIFKELSPPVPGWVPPPLGQHAQKLAGLQQW